MDDQQPSTPPARQPSPGRPNQSDSDSPDHQVTYHEMAPRAIEPLRGNPSQLESHPLPSDYQQNPTYLPQQENETPGFQAASPRTAAPADDASPPYRTPPYRLPPPEAAYDASYMQQASIQDSYQPASPRSPVHAHNSSPPYRLPPPEAAYGQENIPPVPYTVSSPSPSVRSPSPLGPSGSRQTGAMTRVPARPSSTVTERPVSVGERGGRGDKRVGAARGARDGSRSSGSSSGRGPMLDSAILATLIFLVIFLKPSSTAP